MRTPVWILFGWLLSEASIAAEDTPAPARKPGAQGIRLEQLTFFGYDCPDDCSIHKAGFAWAEANGIAEGAACVERGRPFVEGCRAYAERGGSSRDAGHDWAAENEVGDVRACAGAGAPFAEGCLDYLRGTP
jgi:hypothetical protein